MERGLVLINTGEGKGKTTAALGVAFRASGHGQNVLFLQFIKGWDGTGEYKASKKNENIEFRVMGCGFVDANNEAAHKNAAKEALKVLKKEVQNEKWDLVILDEINNAIDYGFISTEAIEEIIDNKPKALNMILTGRNAKASLIARADTVTEMKKVKHAYDHGIIARRGIEF